MAGEGRRGREVVGGRTSAVDRGAGAGCGTGRSRRLCVQLPGGARSEACTVPLSPA